MQLSARVEIGRDVCVCTRGLLPGMSLRHTHVSCGARKILKPTSAVDSGKTVDVGADDRWLGVRADIRQSRRTESRLLPPASTT